MRRGLISWSREELPAATLDARVGRLQAAMQAQGLGAVLAYTSFAQPAAVHWLSNFTPYWSEAMLLVLPDGPPLLLAALTPRVHPWIREVAHVGELIAAPKLGTKAAELLTKCTAASARVGVVGLSELPWSVAEPLFAAGWSQRLVDASDLFASVRQPADDVEWRLACHAARMADAALAAVPAGVADTQALTAAVESAARLAGAEEVLQRLAPQLSRSAALERMEGNAALGERHAHELSVAYKGVWIRLCRSVARREAPASWAKADAWFDAALGRLADPATAAQALRDAPGEVRRWTLEASTGLQPLSVVAANTMDAAASLPEGSLAVVSVALELQDGPWLRSAPVRVGAAGRSQPLLNPQPGA